MLNCKEVSTAIASETFSALAWHQRFGVRMHLVMCRHCRRYAAQLRSIAEGARQLFEAERQSTDALQESILDSLRNR